MFWLEMSRDPVHGGGDWDFGKCLWSPSRKLNGSKWAFWETVLQTRQGDAVLHLRGKGRRASFFGFSSVEADGFETTERPPEPGQWSYATSYYRAFLCDFVPFSDPIVLYEVFTKQEELLHKYFERNKARPRRKKRRLFYVVQSDRLQCLNGAYLSEVDNELADIILGAQYQYPAGERTHQHTVREVNTGEQIHQLRARVGQAQFSNQVRANYSSQCCFPGCTISDNQFIVAGHIARWADAPELRGQVSNGICFCLMHDKAFEAGLFTLSLDYRVWVNISKVASSRWGAENLLPHHGEVIRLGSIPPSEVALRKHWARTRSVPAFSEEVADT